MTHSGSRGHRQDLLFLARLESHLCFYAVFFGEPCSLLPSLKKGGRSGGPQGDSRLTDFLSMGVTLCLPPWSQD